jgi:hypothetical protein
MSRFPQKTKRLLIPAWRRGALLLTLIALLLGSALDSAAPAQPLTAFGVYVKNAGQEPWRIDTLAGEVGRSPVIVSEYKQWDRPPFDVNELNAIWGRGAVPLITWEPMTLNGAPYPLRAIATGYYDEYISESARQARDWGLPIMLRFAHEPNGSWYPWGIRVEGNTPRRYKRAWRHVVEIFRSEGATNVQWVWTPNVNSVDLFPFKKLYPGDAWVDWVGFDGFNWAKDGRWHSFTRVAYNTYEELAKLSSRPMIVGETGCSERGGNKAAWVASALRREIPRFRRIRAVVWFSEEFDDEYAGNMLDSRINSSPESLRAYQWWLRLPRYGLSREALLNTPRRYLKGSPKAPRLPRRGYGRF